MLLNFDTIISSQFQINGNLKWISAYVSNKDLVVDPTQNSRILGKTDYGQNYTHIACTFK